VGGDVPVDSDELLVTDFVNLKIKSAHFFEVAHRNRVCIYVNRDKCSYVYEYLYLYCICQKKMRLDAVSTYRIVSASSIRRALD
jgi:hypothetical protein